MAHVEASQVVPPIEESLGERERSMWKQSI